PNFVRPAVDAARRRLGNSSAFRHHGHDVLDELETRIGGSLHRSTAVLDDGYLSEEVDPDAAACPQNEFENDSRLQRRDYGRSHVEGVRSRAGEPRGVSDPHYRDV